MDSADTAPAPQRSAQATPQAACPGHAEHRRCDSSPPDLPYKAPHRQWRTPKTAWAGGNGMWSLSPPAPARGRQRAEGCNG